MLVVAGSELQIVYLLLVHLDHRLVRNIQPPRGRHHIHCDLLAPRWNKLDCDWHVRLYSFSTIVAA